MVLKSLIGHYKSKRKPIYACFVDFRKAYDTVWRNGLFYKLLRNHNISPKFVRILQSMYTDISGKVRINNSFSDFFMISIGLRQGCNLSPHLFNLYVDDLAKALKEIRNFPVMLNGETIPCLLYADDMLLLSSSQMGLQCSLDLLY